jgi:transposase
MENFFIRILDLEDGWAVESVDTDFSKEEIFIQIVCLLEQLEDAQTGELCRIYDHAPARKWRHLDTMQYKTYIRCELPRIITSQGKIKTVQPNWASGYERHTFLFEHAVIDLLKASKNQTKTAQLMRCGFNVVNRMHLSTTRGMGRRNHTKLVFDQLSTDEKSFKKGHQYLTVLSHPGSGCILDVEEDRTKEACKSLFNTLVPETQLGQATTISMDIRHGVQVWPAYINSAQELLPNAAITHDRFHLIMYVNKAIDQVRRREVKRHDELKNTRYALLKNPENLSEKRRIKFESIISTNYEVSKAWQVRENFKELFSSGKLFAWTLYNKWTADSKRKNIKEIDNVVDTFNKHISGVANALILNLSNALAERLNGKIQELKTVAKGYRTFANFRSVLLFFHGGLDLYSH